MTKTDKETRRMIIKELVWDDRIDASGVIVKLEKAKILLRGRVHNRRAKDLVEEIIKKLPLAKDIKNEIEVEYEDDNKINDNELRNRIDKVLHWDINFKDNKVDVNVEDGKVKLTGKVDTIWRKTYFKSRIFYLRGVKDVQNDLKVCPECETEDKCIKTDIEESLHRHEEIDNSKIKLKVEDGVVEVTGSVRNWYEHETVVQVVENTFGVREIRNDVSLKETQI